MFPHDTKDARTQPLQRSPDPRGRYGAREEAREGSFLEALGRHMRRVERALEFFRVSPRATTSSILSATEFERFLERERSLADRGTRRFCMITLQRMDEDREAFQRLIERIRQRVRSTDLVGHLDEERVALLLTDTAAAGATAVAAWVASAIAALGIRVQSTIYVYPTVEDDRPGSGRGTPPSHGRANGHGNGRANGHAAGNGTHSHTVRWTSGAAVAVPPPSWPVRDLWTELSVPTPAWKRALDILIASVALVLLLPLFLVVAVAIKLDTPGPVIFRQKRAGRGGRPFDFYKFRSMSLDAEARRAELEARNEQTGPVFKIHDDPRITRVGRILRRTSIDELPQLWNVLKGDICLVGPRSPTLYEVAHYDRWQRRRLNVTGGITCTWQVSGRSRIGFEEWMRMDCRYIEQRCLWTDLGLLVRTLPAVIMARGAC